MTRISIWGAAMIGASFPQIVLTQEAAPMKTDPRVEPALRAFLGDPAATALPLAELGPYMAFAMPAAKADEWLPQILGTRAPPIALPANTPPDATLLVLSNADTGEASVAVIDPAIRFAPLPSSLVGRAGEFRKTADGALSLVDPAQGPASGPVGGPAGGPAPETVGAADPAALQKPMESLIASAADGDRVAVAGLVDFEWDRVTALAPGASAAEMQRVLGLPDFRPAPNVRLTLDDGAFLVFLRQDRVVGQYALIPPVVWGSFAGRTFGPGAVIRVERRSPEAGTVLSLTE